MSLKTIEEIIETLDKFNQESYGVERFNQLPLNLDSSTYELSDYINSSAVQLIKLKQQIEDEKYYIRHHSIQMIGNHGYSKINTIQSEKILAHFEQFLMIAKTVDFNAESYHQQVIGLTDRLVNLYDFVNDLRGYFQEYGLLSEYIAFSEIDEFSKSLYVEELNELGKRYSRVYDNPQAIIDNIRSIESETIKIFGQYFRLIDKFVLDINAYDIKALGTQSDAYVNEIKKNSGDVSQFLIDKNYEDTIKVKFTMTASQKIQDYIIFNDLSIAYKKNGEYHSIINEDECDKIYSELQESIIAYTLRKKPKVAKLFSVLSNDSYDDFNTVYIAMQTYIENEAILKNMKIDFDVFNNKSFEAIDDYMHELISQHKLQQYANSILSSKNKHLLTNSALESFKILRESGVSKQTIQDMVGKKIAAIKTEEEFEQYMNKVVAHFSGFSAEVLNQKLTDNYITPVYTESNVVVFEVKDFEISKAFGSPSWCISRNDLYFDNYTDSGSRQYFLYDFNRDEKDNESMIGFTIKKDGSLRTQHAKNDDYHYVDEFLQNITDKILYDNMYDFDLHEESVVRLKDKFDPIKKDTTLMNSKMVKI